MSQSSIYPHDLSERTIRLLTIEPSPADSPIQWTFEERCLDDTSTPYYALSYCWGATGCSARIVCNLYPFLVAANLYSVLLEYRRRGVIIPLWVDAVCINQTNISERTTQVRMMRTIYSRVACVLVWLGEAEATDDIALLMLKIMNAP